MQARIFCWNLLTLAAVTVSLLRPGSTQAQDQYVLTWKGISYTTNAHGAFVAKPFSDKDVVEKVAQDNGLDARGLALVYRVQEEDTAVVNRSDGSFVADVMQMQFSHTQVGNGTAAMKQVILTDEAHPNPVGSAVGTERSKHTSKGALAAYSFRGTFQYAFPETSTIYTGNFSTGKRLNDSTGGSGQ